MLVRVVKGLLHRCPGMGWVREWRRRRKQQQDFAAEFHAFQAASQSRKERFALRWEERLPFLADKTATTEFDRHYVYHTSWAARVLATTRPARHVDIASSLYFVGIVSAFIPTTFYDYRPAE